MQYLNPFPFVPALLALQFVVFGWRIVREIALGDERRRTWLLLSDLLNLASMLAVVALCVVWPLRTATFPLAARATLGAGYVLIAFTPLIVAGHYRLFSREGRNVYLRAGGDYPWVTGQEAVLAAVALACTGLAVCAIALGRG